MSQIFISYASEDKKIVDQICGRLKVDGLPLFEYSENMYGGKISDVIEDEINKSEISIIFVSEHTIDRPWIITESTWLYSAYRKNALKTILIAKVGPCDESAIPPLIRSENFYVFDLIDIKNHYCPVKVNWY